MQLSSHFTLEQMVFSQTAARHGIDNRPGPQAIVALGALCVVILEPIVVRLNRFVVVSSGYRSAALNAVIGGVASSQHLLGEAADIVAHGIDNLELARWIRDNLPFDQLIMEGSWVHVSYGPRARRQALTAHFGKGPVRYTPGLA